MKPAGWWYLIAMVGIGCSIAVMLWAAAERNAVLTVLALLNAAYWGMAAFGSAIDVRQERLTESDKMRLRTFNQPEDHIG